MVRITVIVHGIDKAQEFEWLISEIDSTQFVLSFISLGEQKETHLKKYCEVNNIEFHYVSYQSKKEIISSIFKTRKIIKSIQPDIVHSHLFEGGLIGTTAAWLAGIKKRVYTRHYSDFHHVYFPNGLKFDKWINSKSTHIIAVSKMVKDILVNKEGVEETKVSVIYHGIKTDESEQQSLVERVDDVKSKHGIPKDKVVIGVVSRFTYWKGVQDIIPAFKNLQKVNPNLHLVLANAKGDYKGEIELLLKELPSDSYTEIIFENDNEALFKSFDVFVHVPISAEAEAFGQIYLESMKFGIPSVFTLSGIASEIVVNEKNALVVEYNNANEITVAVRRLLTEDSLRSCLIVNGIEAVKDFTTMKKTKALENLYRAL